MSYKMCNITCMLTADLYKKSCQWLVCIQMNNPFVSASYGLMEVCTVNRILGILLICCMIAMDIKPSRGVDK